MSRNLGIDLFVPKEGSYMYAVSFGMGQKRGLGPRHKLRGFTSYFSLSLSVWIFFTLPLTQKIYITGKCTNLNVLRRLGIGCLINDFIPSIFAHTFHKQGT